jgi:hypothetical protein
MSAVTNGVKVQEGQFNGNLVLDGILMYAGILGNKDAIHHSKSGVRRTGGVE